MTERFATLEDLRRAAYQFVGLPDELARQMAADEADTSADEQQSPEAGQALVPICPVTRQIRS